MLSSLLHQTRWTWGIVIMPKSAWWRSFGPEYTDLFGATRYGSGTYDHRQEVAIWSDAPVPVFRYRLDGGLEALRFSLPRRLGEIGEQGDNAEDVDIGFGNMVEVAVFDEDGADPVLVYRGRIEGYSTDVGPEAEAVQVDVIPWTARLADSWFEGPKTFTATDPKDMLEWFLDNDYLPSFNLDPASQAVGQTYTHTFEKQTLKRIFDDIGKLAGADWYYLLQPDLTILFSQFGTTADHVLTLGKEVASVSFVKDVSRRKTRVIVYGNGVSYTATSADFDPAEPLDLVVREDRITTTAIALRVAETLLELYQGADMRVRARVIDGNGPDTADGRGYDIESIRPGQTCRIVNPENLGQVPIFGQETYGDGFYDGSAAEMSKQVLPIVSIGYGFDYADLELSTRQPSQTDEVARIIDDFQHYAVEAA